MSSKNLYFISLNEAKKPEIMEGYELMERMPSGCEYIDDSDLTAEELIQIFCDEFSLEENDFRKLKVRKKEQAPQPVLLVKPSGMYKILEQIKLEMASEIRQTEDLIKELTRWSKSSGELTAPVSLRSNFYKLRYLTDPWIGPYFHHEGSTRPLTASEFLMHLSSVAGNEDMPTLYVYHMYRVKQ